MTGFAGLREFLDHLGDIGELAVVDKQVDPVYELAGYCRETLDRRGAAMLFTNVAGHSIPVASNLFATRRRFAAALRTTEEEIRREWLRRAKRPIAPRLVDTAPCKEVVLAGDEVDLGALPIPTWNEFDGGPYISLGVVMSQDPETDAYNAATYRLQVHDKNTLGVLYSPYRHLALHQEKRSSEEFPVVVALGLDPATHIAAATPLPAGEDELELAGALRGAPVDLVPCETIPLHAPANAEIVLECVVLPGVLEDEGPFGEFTGFYSGVGPRPVLRVDCITMRREPIFLGTYQGKPPQDSTLLQSIPAEAEILKTVPLPGVRDVHLTDAGGGALTAVVSIEKRFEGYGRMVGLAVLGTWAGRYVKHLTVVTDEIDPTDPAEVEWAVATRVQPHRDVEILHNLSGIIIDPSLPELEVRTRSARTSKMIIDATGYTEEGKREPLLCMPPSDTMKQVHARWDAVVNPSDITSR